MIHKKQVTDEQFFNAINKVIQWATPREAKSSYAGAAKTYAANVGRAGIVYGRPAIATQISYIIANLNNYRGEEARKVKAILKQFQKQIRKEQEQ